MSRFLSGLSKHSPLQRGFRSFSSCSGPFLRLGSTIKEDSPDLIMFDAAKEALLHVPDKTLPQELSDSRLIGACHGWGFFSNLCDRSLCISDYLNPLASKSNPKVISLPPLTSLYTCQTQVFCNVAMSSPPCDHHDWVVAVKFLGRQLSLCRPNRDLRWTNVLTPFTFLENSNLMYSNRDHKFYLPAPGSNHLCSFDLHFKKDDDPKFHKFLYRNRPKLSQSEHELLSSCSKAEHWVESPSGERFLVKCYAYGERDPVFMVFREEETTDKGTIMCYTEDIGDVCIFISGTDPFCLDASLCPGLIPNSIYLMESFFGVYDLATRSIRLFEDQVEGPPKAQEAFNGKKWEKFNSEKVASLAYARIQGKSALIAHFQNSSLMNEDMRCRPIIFDTPNNPDSVDQVVVVVEETKNVDLLDSELSDDGRDKS